MAFNTSNFAGFLQRFTAAVQANAQIAFDFSVGSVVRALGEAVSGVGVWLQYLVLQLIAITRASTSTGADLDSWMADFDFERYGGAPSTGILSPFRANANVQSVIPVGWTVSTVDSSVSVAVTKDTTNAHWNGLLNGYVLNVGTSTIDVPAQSTTNGSGANVGSGALTQIQTPIVGIDSVNNAAAFSGGIDGWSDAQFRAEFVLYLQSLRTSNLGAINYAVSTTPGVARFLIVECQTYAPPGIGATLAGAFFVIVDDGTGSPPASLLNAVDTAVNAMRACGIEYEGAHAPSTVTVNINITVQLAPNSDSTADQSAVEKKIKSYIASFPLGSGVLAVTKLAQLAYAATSDVVNVPYSAITINGLNTDLTLQQEELPIVGTVSVTTI